MPYEIVLGREESEKQKLGTAGAVFLGKHYVSMGTTTALAQPIYLDVNKSHVVFICGKRGSGKSYSLGVIAEGMHLLPEEERKRLSVIILDTMGIYWTMKYPNHREEAMLKEWGFEGRGFDVVIYTPAGFFEKFKEEGIPTDYPFSIKPSELNPEDWNLTFELAFNDPIAVFIERIILQVREHKKNFEIEDIIEAVQSDVKEASFVKVAAENRFRAVQEWGVFLPKSTPMKELAKPGQISVLDLSAYAMMPNGWRIKSLITGLVCQRMFIERMAVRKIEEFESVHAAIHYLVAEEEKESELPLVWFMIDEAHEFLPNQGSTPATSALITLLREGRQPGVSMVLATQQPGKIHTDAMTQSDVILAHNVTAKIDTDALGVLLQSYLREGLDKELGKLPKVPGACIAVDDVNERLYPMRVRPRISWHGGSAPKVLKEIKKLSFAL